ncbi:MAG: hypothetical protein ACTSWQ_11060, partial [Candidatus Thorarchaeota archaeon]
QSTPRGLERHLIQRSSLRRTVSTWLSSAALGAILTFGLGANAQDAGSVQELTPVSFATSGNLTEVNESVISHESRREYQEFHPEDRLTPGLDANELQRLGEIFTAFPNIAQTDPFSAYLMARGRGERDVVPAVGLSYTEREYSLGDGILPLPIEAGHTAIQALEQWVVGGNPYSFDSPRRPHESFQRYSIEDRREIFESVVAFVNDPDAGDGTLAATFSATMSESGPAYLPIELLLVAVQAARGHSYVPISEREADPIAVPTIAPVQPGPLVIPEVPEVPVVPVAQPIPVTPESPIEPEVEEPNPNCISPSYESEVEGIQSEYRQEMDEDILRDADDIERNANDRLEAFARECPDADIDALREQLVEDLEEYRSSDTYVQSQANRTRLQSLEGSLFGSFGGGETPLDSSSMGAEGRVVIGNSRSATRHLRSDVYFRVGNMAANGLPILDRILVGDELISPDGSESLGRLGGGLLLEVGSLRQERGGRTPGWLGTFSLSGNSVSRSGGYAFDQTSIPGWSEETPELEITTEYLNAVQSGSRTLTELNNDLENFALSLGGMFILRQFPRSRFELEFGYSRSQGRADDTEVLVQGHDIRETDVDSQIPRTELETFTSEDINTEIVSAIRQLVDTYSFRLAGDYELARVPGLRVGLDFEVSIENTPEGNNSDTETATTTIEHGETTGVVRIEGLPDMPLDTVESYTSGGEPSVSVNPTESGLRATINPRLIVRYSSVIGDDHRLVIDVGMGPSLQMDQNGDWDANQLPSGSASLLYGSLRDFTAGLKVLSTQGGLNMDVLLAYGQAFDRIIEHIDHTNRIAGRSLIDESVGTPYLVNEFQRFLETSRSGIYSQFGLQLNPVGDAGELGSDSEDVSLEPTLRAMFGGIYQTGRGPIGGSVSLEIPLDGDEVVGDGMSVSVALSILLGVPGLAFRPSITYRESNPITEDEEYTFMANVVYNRPAFAVGSEYSRPELDLGRDDEVEEAYQRVSRPEPVAESVPDAYVAPVQVTPETPVVL